MYIIPRVILVLALIIDTFYFNKLNYIYNILLFGAIPLIHRYLKYSLKYAKELYIKELEDKYDSVMVYDMYYWNRLLLEYYDHCIILDDWEVNPEAIHHNTLKTVKEYMEIKYEALGSDIKYVGLPISNNMKRLGTVGPVNLNEKEILTYAIERYKKRYPELHEEFHEIMPKLIDLYAFLKYYSFATDDARIKWSKVIIFSGYFICWTYIVYKSYGKVEEFPILEGTLNDIYKIVEKEEPFSGL
jgi:hypothetical protein